MSSSCDGTIFHYHPQFQPAATKGVDSTVLTASDGVHYSMPSFILSDATSFFHDLACCQTPIPIDLPSNVVTPLMLLLSGLPVAHPLPFPILEEAVHQLRIWDAPGPLSILQGSLTAYVTLPTPMPNTAVVLQAFGLAMRVGWLAEAEFIARHTLDVDVWSDKLAPELAKLSSEALLRMMKVRRERRDKLSHAVRRYSFGAPPKPPTLIGPRLQDDVDDEQAAVLHGCREPAMNAVVEQLFTKMYWEMDRRPSGSTLAQALTKDEWPEAVACWRLACTECGKSMVDKTSFVVQVRNELSKLPVI